jgi:nitric oxide reductase activation protein
MQRHTRLGGLVPRQQNRDGAAIRHATAKLRACEARTKLLMLVSDGRPLDGDYKDDYSLEDTKAALREARQAGIDPFCVTIDAAADAYLRRMYGDVRFAVIDRVESLPARLPRIYQRLTT